MFVLGIGKEVDPSELNEIASGPKNVFTVDSFEDLEDKAGEVKRGICVKGTLYFFLSVNHDTELIKTLSSQFPLFVPLYSLIKVLFGS